MLAIQILTALLLFAGGILSMRSRASTRWRAAVLCGCAAYWLWSAAFGLAWLSHGLTMAADGGASSPQAVAERIGSGLVTTATACLAVVPALLIVSISFFLGGSRR